MDIHFFARSDVGRVRSANEDYFLNEKIADHEYVFIVADGMGGHQAGDVASSLAAETFVENYKILRKKNFTIANSIEVALKKANQVILKKAAADPNKRGMGTTFSALVISDRKASLVHIGDSRIYMIRKNKIRKLTVDHTFVEKLVEDGRISPDEARDHPQKNVLYMSLGAREGFVPQILGDMDVEDGDVFVMCSDGLSNMVADDYIKEYALSYFPEDAANELITMANANGGTDNITVQIVRVGSLESIEKTKPLRMIRPKTRLITLLSVIGMVAIFFTLRWLIRSIDRDNGNSVEKKPAGSVIQPLTDQDLVRLREIAAPKLADLSLPVAACKFLSADNIFVSADREVVVYNTVSAKLEKLPLGTQDHVIPTASARLFVLRRIPAPNVISQLLPLAADAQPLITIRSDSSFLSKEISSKTIKIPNLKGEIVPEFINDDLFLFHDQMRYYVIMKWPNLLDKGFRVFPIGEFEYADSNRLFIKRIAANYQLMHFRSDEKTVRAYRLKDFAKLGQLQIVADDIPLAIEHFPDHSFTFYFRDRISEWPANGRQGTDRRYRFNGLPLEVERVLIDLESGRKLFLDKNLRIFTMESPS